MAERCEQNDEKSYSESHSFIGLPPLFCLISGQKMVDGRSPETRDFFALGFFCRDLVPAAGRAGAFAHFMVVPFMALVQNAALVFAVFVLSVQKELLGWGNPLGELVIRNWARQ